MAKFCAIIIINEKDAKSADEAINRTINTNTTSPLSITTIAMKEFTQPNEDDYNQIIFKMSLNSKKKLMTIPCPRRRWLWSSRRARNMPRRTI